MLNKQAVVGCVDWLNYKYDLHLITRMGMSWEQESSINNNFVRHVLLPFARYIDTKIASISVVTRNRKCRHIHSLLFSPYVKLSINDVECFKRFMSARNGHYVYCDENNIMAREHEVDRRAYIYDHLINQEGTLHFFNKSLLVRQNDTSSPWYLETEPVTKERIIQPKRAGFSLCPYCGCRAFRATESCPSCGVWKPSKISEQGRR